MDCVLRKESGDEETVPRLPVKLVVRAGEGGGLDSIEEYVRVSFDHMVIQNGEGVKSGQEGIRLSGTPYRMVRDSFFGGWGRSKSAIFSGKK